MKLLLLAFITRIRRALCSHPGAKFNEIGDIECSRCGKGLM